MQLAFPLDDAARRSNADSDPTLSPPPHIPRSRRRTAEATLELDGDAVRFETVRCSAERRLSDLSMCTSTNSSFAPGYPLAGSRRHSRFAVVLWEPLAFSRRRGGKPQLWSGHLCTHRDGKRGAMRLARPATACVSLV
ncbi:hypothetical protein HMN09_00212700 [Mycena chlorophos]|uniref:Uncharacterized protein n=1 Tax=Mycena chlorophos TaxID=658473 RepID=A0A8H6TR20_MYCCL|nr:hypothetical protein HMN09_00212700 [Mycena chlorophos]